jgi:hypothetical protein
MPLLGGASRIKTLPSEDALGEVSGRVLAGAFKVHESTISSDLSFMRRLETRYRKTCFGAEMTVDSFRWAEDGQC